MEKNKRKNVLAVCHDAGGAEVISAYVKANSDKYNFICVVDGPAKKIFKRKKIKKYFAGKNINPDKFLDKYNIGSVIACNSWGSPLEVNFVKAAKSKKIKAITYLDHWGDYRVSFGYPRKDWKANLPDEIWAGDKYAYKKAKKYFAGLPVKLVLNNYFNEIKEDFKKISGNAGQSLFVILFMSEPVTSPANSFGDKSKKNYSEFYVLEEFLKYLSKHVHKEKFKAVICFHPSEKRNKYDSVILKYSKGLNIAKQRGGVLKNIANANLILGMESMILAIAQICGKKVVSFIPNKNIKCPLPFEGIKKIRRVEELSKLLDN